MKFRFFKPVATSITHAEPGWWSHEAQQLYKRAGSEPTETNPFYKQPDEDAYYCQLDRLSITYEPGSHNLYLNGEWRGKLMYRKKVKGVHFDLGDTVNFSGLESRIRIDMELTGSEP